LATSQPDGTSGEQIKREREREREKERLWYN
jgi:hypothetical protein